MADELTRDDAAYVCELAYRRAAIMLDDSKGYLIAARLGQLAQDRGFTTIAALVAQARRGIAGVETQIIEALTTHETLFFRDAHPFELLKKHLLPELIAKRAKNRSLTIWSAACSTGQEPYSVAMLLLEHFPEVVAWPVKIIATDISDQIVAKAKEARFRQLEVNRGLPATMMAKYFERDGLDFRLKPVVRNMVEFRRLNLLDSWSIPTGIDIVMIRNVLIYFDLERKREIFRRLRNVVAPDGGLMLGAAETTLNIDDQWVRHGVGMSSFYRPLR
jgi:chemotaxis protein methyltransferase CheR